MARWARRRRSVSSASVLPPRTLTQLTARTRRASRSPTRTPTGGKRRPKPTSAVRPPRRCRPRRRWKRPMSPSVPPSCSVPSVLGQPRRRISSSRRKSRSSASRSPPKPKPRSCVGWRAGRPTPSSQSWRPKPGVIARFSCGARKVCASWLALPEKMRVSLRF